VLLANLSCRHDQARSVFQTRPVVGKSHRIPVSFSLARYHDKKYASRGITHPLPVWVPILRLPKRPDVVTAASYALMRVSQPNANAHSDL
jgi:hypothetical protein